MIQAVEGVTPFYRVVERSGPVHAAVFTVEVLAGERVLGRGQGLGSARPSSRAASRPWPGSPRRAGLCPPPDRPQGDSRPTAP